MRKWLILTLAMLGPASTALAQVSQPTPATTVPIDETPLLTVRVHAGPNYNLMGDWRDGFETLRDEARSRGLSPSDRSCICMSWGTAALAHITPRLAVGGEFEMLRDTRHFSVQDVMPFTGTLGSFGFTNESVVRASQALATYYPRPGSRTHVQFGAGLGRGHTRFSTPGSDARGRVRGWLVTTSIGTEARFWYVDAGWRFSRMDVTQDEILDHDIDERRDVFNTQADVRQFVQQRSVDFTGGWVRLGVALHFGRR